MLGQYDNAIYAQYHKIMAWLGTWPADMNALLECSMEIGQMNFKVMSILDAGETTKYGHPTPTQVNVKATEGKCILISGHDLKDLYNPAGADGRHRRQRLYSWRNAAGSRLSGAA